MADPISIASGVAGLLSLGIQVAQSLAIFYSAYKDQDADLAKITQNLDDLQGTFRSLDIEVQRRQSQADAKELLQEVDKATQRCDGIIKELESECQKFRKDSATGYKGRIRVAGRRAAYPFRKSTLQKLEEDVCEIRENLSFALDVLQLRGQNQIQDGISELKSLIGRMDDSQVSSTIRAWLMAPDASLNHNTTYAKHHISTGLWFINGGSFANWLVEHNSFLWLNGFAGCGKSVLCSIAIHHISCEMKHRYRVGIAFFYFTFNEESKRDDLGMLRALLLQLSTQLGEGAQENGLEQLHLLYRSTTPPIDVLIDALRSILCRFREAFILLDALDESPRDCKREGVLEAIRVMRRWCLPGLHLLVTSRNELDISGSLNPTRDQNVSMKNIEVDKDIDTFVSYQLSTEPRLQRWKTRHSDIQAKLTKKAQGVFRYVECQFNALKRARNRNQLDDCLRSLPSDLEETYKRILCSIDETYAEDVRRILTLLCFSGRPLTINELIDAHAIELGESPRLDREGRSYNQDDLIDICLGLVEIVVTKDDNGQHTSTVRIAHFSVQEYLQSDHILQQRLGRFAIQSGSANTEIAQICLIYLLEPNLSSGILNEAKLVEFPLAHFAAMQWYYHYTNSQEGKPKVEQLLPRLFKDDMNSFVTWIRLHDMDYPQNAEVDYCRPIDNMASPLYYATLLGLDSVLNIIIGPDVQDASTYEIVNAPGGRYGNALQVASVKSHTKMVQILLNRGADVNAQGGGEYYQELLEEVSKVYRQIMRLDRETDANARRGVDHKTVQRGVGYLDALRTLFDPEATFNLQGRFWGNALQAASVNGDEKVVQMLLDRGADVNAGVGFYGNALQAASFNGNKRIVQMLLDRGADVNAQIGFYGNALQAAVKNGDEEVVQILLDRGADVNVQGGELDPL